MKKIAIIGAGSWGTALSIVLSHSRSPHSICLWAHEQEVISSLRETRSNSLFLSGEMVPNSVEITGDVAHAVKDAAIVLGVMPSQHARSLYMQIFKHAGPEAIVVSATKGLEPDTLLRMTQVIAQAAEKSSPKDGATRAPRIAVLSGPSFAREVARGDPTSIVAASEDADIAEEVQEEFAGPTFRPYTNSDVIGVELAGSVKNVIAIAAGVTEGLGLGHNTLAALITRGLAEITRLSIALGGRRETMAGLAGIGDLVLTCTGALSRNRHVGVELGKGRPLQEILDSTRMVAEGVPTTAAARTLARQLSIEMPITEQMYDVLHNGRSSQDAVRNLMDRRLTVE